MFIETCSHVCFPIIHVKMISIDSSVPTPKNAKNKQTMQKNTQNAKKKKKNTRQKNKSVGSAFRARFELCLLCTGRCHGRRGPIEDGRGDGLRIQKVHVAVGLTDTEGQTWWNFWKGGSESWEKHGKTNELFVFHFFFKYVCWLCCLKASSALIGEARQNNDMTSNIPFQDGTMKHVETAPGKLLMVILYSTVY